MIDIDRTVLFLWVVSGGVSLDFFANFLKENTKRSRFGIAVILGFTVPIFFISGPCYAFGTIIWQWNKGK